MGDLKGRERCAILWHVESWNGGEGDGSDRKGDKA